MGEIVDKVKLYLDKIEKEDKGPGGINSFLSINPNVLKEAEALERGNKKGKLYGVVVGVKSNICVKGLEVNCASKTLEGFRAGYDATVIERIKGAGGLIIGMLNMDEFASGNSGENSAFGPTKNPIVDGKIAGGSSSGSAAAVAAGFCDISLGSDTGGSIRNPASHCGIIGVKPSYGMVSRYGLIDLSMSLDQIGPLGKDMVGVGKVLEVISGKDDRDTMTVNFSFEKEKIRGIKIGVVKVKGVDKRIQDLIDEKVDNLKEKIGWSVKKVKINHLELGVQTYYPLVYVEFYSGTRKFQGRLFGKKIEDSCGPEVSRRILGGSEISKAEFSGRYYNKALEVKKLIEGEFSRVFEDVDCLLLPVVPVLPWNIGEGKGMEVEEIYAADALTCPMNLAGVCALSLPVGEVEKIPVGIQVVCAKGKDNMMIEIAQRLENLKI
jgi:aspartyl-tRNA(Asn)/glutamyl-tRNA(Gln) amidotransferase subunit A